MLAAIGDMFGRIYDQMVGRFYGPMHLRLIVMPCVVTVIAIQAGWRDARKRKPPYLSSVIGDPAIRRAQIRAAWPALKRIVLMAFVLDFVYQIYVFRAYYVFQTVLLTLVVVILPYILVRGTTTRVARVFYKAN